MPLFLAAVLPARAEVVSGSYYGLNLIVRGDAVAGVFATGIGRPESRILCVFLLEGTMKDGEARISTWLPDDPARIDGLLRAEATGVSLKLDDDPPGCGMAEGDMRQWRRYDLDEAEPGWIGAGVVSNERAVLRPAPAEMPRRERPYLVRFDDVVELERREGFVRVEYQSEDGPVRGWLRKDELSSVPVPAR